MASGDITCRRVGNKYTRKWPQREAKGYDVLATDGSRSWLAGFATQATSMGGKPNGWIVLDVNTGETILGAGTSTRVGNGLGDCLYVFGVELTKAASP